MVKIMPKPKHEYEVYIKNTVVHAVFVMADDYEEAEKLAEEKFYNGETEYKYELMDVEVNWSDEED